jgi:hypothetical protein
MICCWFVFLVLFFHELNVSYNIVLVEIRVLNKGL